ncbi:30357_t:CDS:2 [Gigaspora margarita]|uniref:30357_t:CDS:1 n=1 Tax=Gigaspora margarita TaxID=4874 RepID=A0ABN7VBG7_GIGMA|nr:30357_t:CDS:2 [Gigaspora margarita]
MNKQEQSLLPNISLNQPNNNSVYLNSRHEEDKQRKSHKKKRLERHQEAKSIDKDQLSANDQKLLCNFHNIMTKLCNNLCGICNERFPSIELFKEEYSHYYIRKAYQKSFLRKQHGPSLIIDHLPQISNNQSIYEKNNYSNINKSNEHLANSDDKSDDSISRTFVPALPPRNSENEAINNTLN